MTKKTKNDNSGFERIPFRMHPRVFAALGADLVTNDVVAVIELVKNSYDAFARNVWIRFREDTDFGSLLEIEDDGSGMTREIVEDVWCLVGTPYKANYPFSKYGAKERRVAGEKGLGRLSVARLGNELHMLTKSDGDPCWEVSVNWSEISSGDDIAESFAGCRRYPGTPPFNESGTRLQIRDLKGQWDDNRLSDLEDYLARLISPFSNTEMGDFNIFLSNAGAKRSEEVKIESPNFLSEPKYSIAGNVNKHGNVKATYHFEPVAEGDARDQEFELTWEQIYDVIQDRSQFPYISEQAHCGPFSFEIRAWDIGPDDTQEIYEKYGFQKSHVRKSIRAHKGLSVYRDGILVLPKSEGARDWLGLDLRRISKVGTRLSTTQLVGYVSISSESNPRIKDTSDRERLASCLEVAEFEEILKAVVARLENERDIDRIKPSMEKPMDDLFQELSAEELIAEVIALSEEDSHVSEAIPLLSAFSQSLDRARKTIQKRFVYYSRMATIGTIAQMLVHEIRNRTIAFGSFLEFIKNRFSPFKEKGMKEEYKVADNAVTSLEHLADTFSPLSSRSFRRRRRYSVLEEQIRECLDLQRGEIKRKRIRCYVPNSETRVVADPGELDTILLNLITNAVYWLGEVPKKDRELEFRIVTINDGDRARVWVHDTGPGIDEEDVEKVFWPGITRKPGGIGMGLTVASELVQVYGGRMLAKHPGTKGGASFAFDLKLRK